MGIKVAVIGGGSTYTPELVEGVALRRDVLPVDELVAPRHRRRAPGGRRRTRRAHPGATTASTGRLTTTTDRAAAIVGASFVLVQLRVGGMAARLRDETIPLRFGCIGQETTGPGGFAKALRTVPVVLDIADDTRRLRRTRRLAARLHQPCRASSRRRCSTMVYRAIGLCNVPIGFQRHFAGASA